MIRIVTDSTCDLSDELLAQHRISVVPINIQFGQDSYQEKVTIGPALFYSGCRYNIQGVTRAYFVDFSTAAAHRLSSPPR